MTVGAYIKKLRQDAGYSQEELGQLLGVQRAAVQKWECGKVQNLKRETIYRLSELFSVPTASFFRDDEGNTIDGESLLPLSAHETAVLRAYRQSAELHRLLDKLLDLDGEELDEKQLADLLKAPTTDDRN